MIRRIVKVDGAGIFDRWKPSPVIEEFSRVNVVFGGNGSGKSSLARAFSSVAAGEGTEVSVSLDVEDADGARRRVSDSADSFWTRVRVFDRSFVEKNLLFDVDGRSDARPLLVLGKPNVEREKRIAEIDARLATIDDEELPEAHRTKATHEKTAGDLATSTARTIVQELRAVGGRFQGRSYTATQVRRALRDPRTSRLERTDEEIAADLQIVQGRREAEIPTLPVEPFVLKPHESAVDAALEMSITSIAIAELSGDASAERWVREGVSLHEHRQLCLLCGNELDADRRGTLERHFDASFNELQQRLDSVDRALHAEEERVAAALASAPSAGLLYGDLRADYEKSLEQLARVAARYRARIGELRGRVEAKRSSPFSRVDTVALSVESETLDFAAVNAVLARHNQRSADFEQEISEAADRIERARLTSIESSYGAAQRNAKSAAARIDELSTERKRLDDERERIGHDRLDSAPLADELTRDIAALLGRGDLVFSKRGDRYTIERDGEPATALSEGERTAISLLYFLCSLRDEKTRGVAATVVIDDPVSSLDHEILVGVSGHLWSALVGNGSPHQVILLTHSFDLFRMWSNQLDRLPSKTKRNECTYSIYELRTRFDADRSGGVARRPAILSWPDAGLRKKLRSQYHYLFWQVGSHTIESGREGDILGELNAEAVIPNAARRMLEAFLAFKYPSQIGNFDGSMRRAFDESEAPDGLRQRVTRFLHQQSHNEEADISRPVNIGESISVLRAAFELIEAVDRAHFVDMCEALGLDGRLLVVSSPGSDSLKPPAAVAAATA